MLLSHLVLVDLFRVGANTVQAKLLHNGQDSFCTDAQTVFSQNSTDLISAIPLFAIIEDLFYFQHELSLLGFIFATICAAENMIIECTTLNEEYYYEIDKIEDAESRRVEAIEQIAVNASLKELDCLWEMLEFKVPENNSRDFCLGLSVICQKNNDYLQL